VSGHVLGFDSEVQQDVEAPSDHSPQICRAFRPAEFQIISHERQQLVVGRVVSTIFEIFLMLAFEHLRQRAVR
jgi:hypothetical protein